MFIRIHEDEFCDQLNTLEECYAYIKECHMEIQDLQDRLDSDEDALIERGEYD